MDVKDIGDGPPCKRVYYSETVIGKEKVALLPTATPRRTKLTWQILTEQHSPIVKDIKVQRAESYLGAAERWMSFPEDRSITFPAETFLPKVQMEYSIELKALPRNVEMERRRRAYKNLKIEGALEAEGVEPRDMLPPEKARRLLSREEKYGLRPRASYLPLEVFDDVEYDCRTVDDWLNLGIVDGVRYPLPAMVFIEKAVRKERTFYRDDKSPSDLFTWSHAAVTDYDRESGLWTVLTLDGLKREFFLPRIYIWFFGEDPRKFARRVALAVKQRRIAEAAIRYRFYLDCMRVDGMPTLDEERQEAVALSAIRRGSMKYKSKHLSSLMDEILLEYRRAMCDLMWRSLVAKQPEVFDFIALEKIDEARDDVEPPESGKIYTGAEDYASTKDHFHRTVLYVLPEVYEAMRCVVAECIHASSMNLFVSNYGKSMPLSEFETQQNQETGNVMKYLKGSWLERITQSVRMCLRDIGEDWFDLEQTDREAYEATRLKPFLDLAVLRMQSALRNLVEKSIALYLETLEAPAICVLDVDDDFAWGDDLVNTRFKCTVNPIFNVDIAMDDNTVCYSTDLESFEEAIVGLLDNSLGQCREIRQIHPFLLPLLEFPKDLYLSSVDLSERQVCEVRDRLRIAYRRSIIPLRAYASEYRQYLGIFKLDVKRYVEDFKNADHTAAEVKDEIAFHSRMKSSLERALPKEIVIGPFRVDVRPLRRSLIEKRRDCCDQLLIMFSENLRAQIDAVLADYMQIRTRLRATSRDIQHSYEERDWSETVPLTVRALDVTVQKLKPEFDILDHFWWNLSDQDFEAKWRAMSFPRQVQLYLEEATQRFADEYEKFYKLQVQDEIMLSEKIDMLVGNVINMALQTDIDKVHETATEAKRIWRMMRDCQESGLLLNERQKLFSMEVVPFERLNELMKEFEPYQSLWTTASDWLKWQEIWMENPLINVDGDQIESMIVDMHKAVSRCAKIFQENPKVAAIAHTVRDQIEAFKPYVSVIQALREPGMKTHHFDELNRQTGMQMALTPSVTLKNLLVLGVMEFEGILKTVANAAAKEYSIESTLDKMTIEWNAITMDVLPYKNTGTYVMKISDEIVALLDDNILDIQHISFNPFKAAFESRVDEWEDKLRLIRDVIALWVEVQKLWMYLEPIFSSEDINRQLPVETQKFDTMERNWRRIMKNAYDCPYVNAK